MTRRPPCSRSCPLIRDCTDCGWQSLTPAPFIIGVSAVQTACDPVTKGAGRGKMNPSTETAPAGNRGLTTDWIGVEMAVSKRTRFEVLRRDAHTCRYCKSTTSPLTVDHVTPVALGGTDDPSNLVAACKDCNAGKSSSSPDAPLVAQVADDAVRWSAAMKAAYDEANVDLKKRRAYIRKFERAWDKYKVGGNAVERPATYTNTIGHWFQIEVPFEVVEYGIERAMGNDKIRNPDVFRYMCGIVWKRIEMAREATEATVRADDGSSPVAPVEAAPTYEDGFNAAAAVAERRLGMSSLLVAALIDRIPRPNTVKRNHRAIDAIHQGYDLSGVFADG